MAMSASNIMMSIDVVLVTILLYLLYKKMKKVGPLSNIPGPKSWPIVGNMFTMSKGLRHKTYQELSEKYGKMFKISSTSGDAIVVSDKELVREVLGTKSKDFSARPKSYILQSTSFNYSSLSFMDYGKEYVHLRKLFCGAFKKIYAEDIEIVMQNSMNDLVAGARAKKGEPFDPHDMLHTAIFQIDMYIAIGVKPESLRPYQNLVLQVISELIDIYNNQGALLDLFPWLRYFKFNMQKKIEKANNLMEELYVMLSNTENLCSENLFAKLKHAQENQIAGITKNHVKMAIIESMITGTSPVLFGMYSYLNIMVHYPHVQKKIQDEIDRVVGRDRSVQPDDREKLPYIQACILELVRYNSNTTVSRPHRTSKETTLGGFTLPVDTDVIVNYWALNHDPETWENPGEFQPERFLKDDGTLLEPGEGARACEFGFGGGVRACLGPTFGKAMIFLLLGNMAQNFTIKAETDVSEQMSCDPLQFKQGLLCCPHPYKIRMEPRE